MFTGKRLIFAFFIGKTLIITLLVFFSTQEVLCSNKKNQIKLQSNTFSFSRFHALLRINPGLRSIFEDSKICINIHFTRTLQNFFQDFPVLEKFHNKIAGLSRFTRT